MANEGIISQNLLQNQFKASGVYTIYRDQTVSARLTSSGPIRLIYGFSKKGIFNTPVFIDKGDYEVAERIFGKIDTQLERNGSFFHRSIMDALQEGPILAMNLLKLNSDTDQITGIPTTDADLVEYKSFSVDTSAANGIATEKLYASFYDKQRFWKPSRSYLLATRSNADKGKLLNVTNLSQSPISFIIRKSEVRGYDMTIKEWYADSEIPKYLNPNDSVKDTFVDIVAIYGDFGSDYNTLAADPVYGKYFTNQGIIISEFQNFLNRPEIRLVDIFTGSMIPNFKNKNGDSLFIETIVNQKTKTTGIMLSVDREEFDKYETGTNTNFFDLVGHRLINSNTSICDFLSYKKRILQDFGYGQKSSNVTTKLEITSSDIVSSVGKLTITIPSTHPKFVQYQSLAIGDLIAGKTTTAGTTSGITITKPTLIINKLSKTNTSIIFDVTSPLKSTETINSGSYVDVDLTPAVAEVKATSEVEVTTTFGNVPPAGGIMAISVKDKNTNVVLVSTSINIVANMAMDTIAFDLAANITNSNTGFTAVRGSGTKTKNVIITAPSNTFDYPNNNYEVVVDFTGTTGITMVSNPFTGGSGSLAFVNWLSDITKFDIDSTNKFYVADIQNQIYKDFENGVLTNGDKLISSTNETYYIKLEKVKSSVDYRDQLKISLYEDKELTVAYTDDVMQFGSTKDSQGFAVANKINFISLIDSINKRLSIVSNTSNSVIMDISYESDIKIGDYLVSYDANNDEILSKIHSIKRIKDNAGIPTSIEVTVYDKIKLFEYNNGDQIERYVPLTSFFTTYDISVLDGFKMKQTHMPNGTNQRMKEILSVMLDTNIAKALKDPDMIDFRYLVDTFNHGLETQSKRNLTRLVRDRSKCIALLNAPSIKEFSDSTNPRFTDTPSPSNPIPTLNAKYIYQGGNLEENPDFLFTLPEEEDGASYAGFFSPNLIVRDDSGDDVSYPPAAIVSNNFVKKYNGGNPFLATAGPKRGILTGNGLIGVEYEFDQEDRGWMEEKGINPLQLKKDGSIVIMGNETAYQRYSSVLNQLNVRDMLVTIEIEHTKILDQYLFEYNNDSIRSEVDSLLRDYLNTLKNAYKCLNSFDIIFDRNNNPNFILREEAAVVDVVVEPTSTTRKYIQRITLKRGSQPSVGGFVAI